MSGALPGKILRHLFGASHQNLQRTGETVGDGNDVRWSIKALCGKLGMSRQNYYAVRRHRQRKEVDAMLVEELVKAERRVQPRLGSRKLLILLREPLAEAGVELGRDRFFKILREKGLLLDTLPRSPRTTNSLHSLPIFRNLLKDMDLTGPNQAWVADLTYIRTDEGFLYAALITDACGRARSWAFTSERAWRQRVVWSH